MSRQGVLAAKIRTRTGFYVYDPSTNLILRVDELTWRLFDRLFAWPTDRIIAQYASMYEPSELQKAAERLRVLKSEGYFLTTGLRSRLTSPSFFASHVLDLYRHVRQLILSVTDQCNLRCKYCAYSGGYRGRPAHSDRAMTRPIAEAALRYYSTHLPADGKPAIGFYGGEPLLAFPLINWCVNTWRSLVPENPARFSLTTNGLLLRGRIADYLVENQFNVLVSVDGPREIHDANRTYANGKGSFDTVLKNLVTLTRRYPEFSRTRLHFSAVMSPFTNFEKLRCFFGENPDLFSHSAILINSITPGHSDYFSGHARGMHYDSEGFERLRREYLRDLARERKTNKRLLDETFRPEFLAIHHRPIVQVGRTPHLMPACVPGEMSLFVDPAGDFHMCEKVPRTMRIGNVFSGIDADCVTRLYREYYSIANSKRCLNCWAVRLCTACYATFSTDGQLAPPSLRMCQNRKQGILKSLSEYCQVTEDNEHAFDYLDSWETEPSTPGFVLLAKGNSERGRQSKTHGLRYKRRCQQPIHSR